MPLCEIDYICSDCGKLIPENLIREVFSIPLSQRGQLVCPCGGKAMVNGFPKLNNTRDSFGVGREFYDVKTGKYIDNFKSWEKAGFKQPGDSGAKNSDQIKRQVKEMKKRKNYQTKSKSINLAERV